MVGSIFAIEKKVDGVSAVVTATLSKSCDVLPMDAGCLTKTYFIMRKEIHVVSNPDRGGWDARRPHANRASKHFGTKKEAMDWSRELAKKEGLELIPHGTDGKIQNPNSYGSNDPCPPKDNKH